MAEAAAYRGPDGIRYWSSGPAGLANLALNITPESFCERQPLVGRCGELVLTADARVDNREELIPALLAEGYLRGRYHTDADVILASYRCWGEGAPARIIGDFAFAVWDSMRERLFAARDAMGTRPLYYRAEPRRLLFATEIKQILAAPGVPARIFEPAIGAFLAGQAGPPEWTCYEGIVQLPPSHALTVDADGVRVRRYWDIDPDYRIEYKDEEEYAEHFAEILREAVRCRMRSTKPVGIFLSGGMDSGSVAATAGSLLRRGEMEGHPGFRAYSWAFEEFAQADERHISDRIARHYDLPVTRVPADSCWPLKDYPEHGPDRGDPFLPFFRCLADSTLSAAREEGTGLMLTGGLGDMMVGSAIFGYLDQLREGRWREMRDDLRDHGRLWNVQRRRLVGEYMLKPLQESLLPPGRAGWLRGPCRRALGRPGPYPGWIRPEFARRVHLEDTLRRSMPPLSVSGFARSARYRAVFWPVSTRDTVTWEIGNARYGLGDADPFGDRRVASFVLAVPQEVLNGAGEFKRVARRAMRGIMPEEARKNAGKIDPRPLFDAAIRDRARDTVQSLMEKPRVEAYGFVDGQALADHVNAYRRGDHGRLHWWHTLTLEMWLRRYWA